MRDQPIRPVGQDRGRRRIALAILLTSTAPALANPPGRQTFRASGSSIQSNPFCEPVNTVGESVYLASGAERSTIRLTPVGKAIGLHSMEQAPLNRDLADANLPSDPSAAKMTIESVPRIIQTNPLIDSVHHPNRSLVDAEVGVTEPADNPVRSRPVDKNILNTGEKPSPSPPQQAVQFSLTDRSPQPRNAAAQAAPQTRLLDDPIRFKQPVESILEPLGTPLNGRSKVIERAVENQVSFRRSQRYRPPVAIQAVPLQIERSSDGDADEAIVRAVPVFEPDSVSAADNGHTKITALHMNLAQVRTLTLGEDLRAVKVADSTICRAVAAGKRQLKLVGTSTGVTQLVVFAKGQNPDDQTLQRAFEIHVTDSAESAHTSLDEICQQLNDSIYEQFPDCEVIVLEQDDQLTVAGRCDNQESAKMIMRMVRKTCLVPVKDELVVH